MIIQPLPLAGAALIQSEPFRDHRGIFARFFCRRELEPLLKGRQLVNVNFSCTRLAGTVRGLHFQRHPNEEMKLVRCIRGSVYDVLVDIRPHSPTYLHWCGEALTAENMKMLCVPEGFAHGFQAVDDDCELLYLTTAPYAPEFEGGIRYDDPALQIQWPLLVTDVSDKDSSHPLLSVEDHPGHNRFDELLS